MTKRKLDPLPTITASTREAAEAWILAHYPPSPPELPAPLPTASISADEIGILPVEAQIYPLYLWLVERPYPKPAWDVTNAVVITAGTEQLAREYFPLNLVRKSQTWIARFCS